VPVFSIVRTIKYSETTDHMRSPCACNATVGDYHDDGDENRRLNNITRIALFDVGAAQPRSRSYGERP
jgi:hypothetical protein